MFSNAVTGEPHDAPLGSHAGAAFCVAFIPDEQSLASTSSDVTIRLWDLTDPQGEPVLLQGHERVVHAVAFVPNRRTVGSGGYASTVLLWLT
jgi:WD40 repeat protein